MSETPINTPTEQPATQSDNDFDDILAIQKVQEAKRVQDAAKRILDGDQGETSTWEPRTESEEPRGETKRNAGKIAAGAALALGVTVGAGMAANAHDTPRFSEETTTWIADDGDGLTAAVNNIEGIEKIDPRIAVEYVSTFSTDNINALEDGLQVGESIEIPISVNGAETSDK